MYFSLFYFPFSVPNYSTLLVSSPFCSIPFYSSILILNYSSLLYTTLFYVRISLHSTLALINCYYFIVLYFFCQFPLMLFYFISTLLSVCSQAGTTGYMAPEVLRQENYHKSVDWWSLGCSIYEMVAARLPYKDFREKVHKEEVTRRTLEDECRFQQKLFDAHTKCIISQFLMKKVEHRLGCW